jgi:hypothetical protein
MRLLQQGGIVLIFKTDGLRPHACKTSQFFFTTASHRVYIGQSGQRLRPEPGNLRSFFGRGLQNSRRAVKPVHQAPESGYSQAWNQTQAHPIKDIDHVPLVFQSKKTSEKGTYPVRWGL